MFQAEEMTRTKFWRQKRECVALPFTEKNELSKSSGDGQR